MHVKVNYNAGGEGSPSTAERQAMEAAVAAWNAHSNTSGVVIEVAQPGEDVHLEFAFTTNANLTGGCAAFHNLMSRIHWGADARQRAATLGNVQLATLFMHEIGHFLGLDENNNEPNQIMQQGTDCQTATTASTVSQSSAQQVKDCIMAACTPPPPPTPTPTPAGTSCQPFERYTPVYNSEGQVVRWEYESWWECSAS